jgi:hypothetical protein
MTVRAFALLIAAIIAFTVDPTNALRADGPQDNAAANVRPVPPPGIEIDEERRKELEAHVSLLDQAIADLAKEDSPRIRSLLPDIQIFAKAANWALKYNEIFHKDDIARIEKCIETGLKRASQLARGKATGSEERGPIVRGYVSMFDGRVQP